MVNLPRGQEVSGLHGAPSQLQGEILRLVRLDGLSVCEQGRTTVNTFVVIVLGHQKLDADPQQQ